VTIYLPLRAGTKQPAVSGWAAEDYPGVEHESGDWHGLRADGLVIVDCDTREAAEAWQHARGYARTLTIKTPRGTHFYYRWTQGSPEGPFVDVFPDVDIRAGRGSYVVAPGAPGYAVSDPHTISDFDPTWLAEANIPGARTVYTGAVSDVIEAGSRNADLAAIGGAMRRQGLTARGIARGLLALNATIVDPPLETEEVVQIAASVGRYTPNPDPVIELEDD
jgi:hypothetical protein